MNSNANKLRKRITDVCLAIVVLLVVIIAVFYWIGGEQSKLSVGPFGMYTVMTGSMSPTFDAGSMIVIQKESAAEYKIGDIIAYTRADVGHPITHRIVAVNREEEIAGYITRGDANNVNDLRPVSQEQIIGRVIFWINGFGNVLLFLRSPSGIATVVLAVLLLLLISMLWDTVSKRHAQ